MNVKSLWKYVPPAGPIFSVTLIGLVLLSALLYYRAVKIQRFLEPALALSQPRNEFTKSINSIFEKEFKAKSIKGLKIRSSSILMETSLLFSGDGALKVSAQDDLQKFARIFLSLMKDDHTRSEISQVLIIGRYPSYGLTKMTIMERAKVQRMVGFIQDALFHLEPELEIKYAAYFEGAAQSTNPQEKQSEVVEFRIVPSEFLHIEVLEKLEKYAY
ncbi:MAG TPA: hypothetical protein VL087_11190 [Nitrospirota bacterium]|nr:hypothetical protein [Nitrospirota bacterium]